MVFVFLYAIKIYTMNWVAKHRTLFLGSLESGTATLHATGFSPQLPLLGLKMRFDPCVSRSGVSLDNPFPLLEANLLGPALMVLFEHFLVKAVLQLYSYSGMLGVNPSNVLMLGGRHKSVSIKFLHYNLTGIIIKLLFGSPAGCSLLNPKFCLSACSTKGLKGLWSGMVFEKMF